MRETRLQKTIKAAVYRSEERYVAECAGISVVTQGDTMNETLRNLQEAVALHLDGENPADFGLEPNPTILCDSAR
jgi:predicted RNase H-like HicB family nuclease